MRHQSLFPRTASPTMDASKPRRYVVTLTVATALAALAGCHKKPPSEAMAEVPKPRPKPEVSEIDLRSYKPNEAGAVMIVMYHRFDPKGKDDDMNRLPDTFHKDLQTFYDKGYRPATVSEFVQNKMDVPPGKTPVVLTFDDSWDTQFKIINGKDGQPHIDPECAVGMMETFSKSHPDWKTKGTFFVLPKEGRNADPFYQPESVADKFAYLIKAGYEIANHTSTHSSMRGMGKDKVQWEIGTAVRDIKQIAPDAQMHTLALPYGQVPHKDAVQYLKDGKISGTQYHNIAVLRAAWRPCLPLTVKADKKFAQGGKLCLFNPYELERIKPNPAQANMPGTLEYYIKFFDENPTLKYVSDGNPNVIAIPKAYASMVNQTAIAKSGQVLQMYGFGGTKGGTGLSVESASGASTSGSTPGSSAGSGLGVEVTK